MTHYSRLFNCNKLLGDHYNYFVMLRFCYRGCNLQKQWDKIKGNLNSGTEKNILVILTKFCYISVLYNESLFLSFSLISQFLKQLLNVNSFNDIYRPVYLKLYDIIKWIFMRIHCNLICIVWISSAMNHDLTWLEKGGLILSLKFGTTVGIANVRSLLRNGEFITTPGWTFALLGLNFQYLPLTKWHSCLYIFERPAVVCCETCLYVLKCFCLQRSRHGYLCALSPQV